MRRKNTDAIVIPVTSEASMALPTSQREPKLFINSSDSNSKAAASLRQNPNTQWHLPNKTHPQHKTP